MGRVVRNNEHLVSVVVFGPGDPWSRQAASLGVMTNTFSPASKGTDFTGDRGYGVNRWAGATSYPLQTFGTAVVPVAVPGSVGVGLGAGVSGQPGLPSTGNPTLVNPLSAMSVGPAGHTRLGG